MGTLYHVLTLSERQRMCAVTTATLNGIPAFISGARCEFAVIRTMEGHAVEYAWSTVARVLANDGAFKS